MVASLFRYGWVLAIHEKAERGSATSGHQRPRPARKAIPEN
jgi:hypothetical protein